MKITKLTLKKHKFFALRNIKQLVFEPNSVFQWVLGTNGSGKSTLLREFSPLAAVKNHYYEGGMKIVEGTDKNLSYRLTCDFSGSKNIYSFIEISPEGVETELNPGHTATVYNNLVWQKFRIDKEIHEIRTGRRRFTACQPMDRKAWISRISDADYTYALGYFKKLLSHYRDVLGSIKTDQNRLLEATTKAVTKEEETQHRELLKHLREEIDNLNDIRPNPSMGQRVVLEETFRIKTSLLNTTKDFRNFLRSNRDIFPLGNLEQNEVDLRGYEIEHSKNSDRVQVLFDRSREITRTLSGRSKTISLDDQNLDERIRTITESHTLIVDSMAFPLDLMLEPHSVKEAIFSYDKWNTALDSIVREMLADPSGVYETTDHDGIFDKHQELITKTNLVELKINKLDDDIQSQLECSKEEHLTCPSCKHQWHPNFSKLVLEDLQDKRTKAVTLLEELKKSKDEVYEKLCFQRKYYAGLKMFNNLEEESPLFRAFYSVVKIEETHKKNPEKLSSLSVQFRHELNTYVKLLEQRDLLREFQNEKLNRTNEQTETIKRLELELKQNTEEISRLYDSSDDIFKKLQYLKRKIALQKKAKEVQAFAKKSKEDLEKLVNTHSEHEARAFIGDMILERNHKLISLEKALREVDLQNHQVATLERQIDEAKEYAKVLRIAVDELSPKEGLIAYGLTGFINHFLKIVNNLIAKFWSYPLELLPFVPNEDGIDLDYKFRIRINDEVAEDISLCSEGQKEIIDLAIMITSLVLEHLDHDCLILDEFGSKLDPAHRMASYRAIEELLSNSNFTRVLMVSHFDESFNTNVQADVSVICDANLELPSNLAYNKNITFN